VRQSAAANVGGLVNPGLLAIKTFVPALPVTVRGLRLTEATARKGVEIYFLGDLQK
jgi:hypothetical protein